MSKWLIGMTCLFIGVIAGLLMGATLIEHDRKVARNIIDSAIVLELPKDEADLAEQLLYLSASKGMLEEIQRQQMVENNAITRPALRDRRVRKDGPFNRIGK